MAFFKSLFGSDPESCRKQAEDYIESGHWGDARLLLDKALKSLQDPHDPKREEIKRLYKTVTERLARSHEDEGDHLQASGLMEEAMERYRLSLELFEGEEEKKRVENKLHIKTDDVPLEVARCFLDENFPQRQGASDHAVAPLEEDPLNYFEVLIHALPEDVADEYRSLGKEFACGYAYTNHGDYSTAVAHYENVSRDHPDQKWVHKEFGRALLFNGDAERAVKELSLAREKGLNDLELSHLLSAAHSENHEYEMALEVLKESQTNNPEEIETCLMIGDLYRKMSEEDNAGQAYEDALKIDPEFPETHSRLGAWAQGQGDRARAIEHYNEAVEFGDNVQDMVTLAELYLEDDRDPEYALGLLNKALYFDPGNRWFYLVRIGEIYLKKGWSDEAKEMLMKAREMIPEDQTEVLKRVNAFLGG